MAGWNRSGVPWYAHPDFVASDQYSFFSALSEIDGKVKVNRCRRDIIAAVWADGDAFAISPDHHYGYGYDGSIFRFFGASVDRMGDLQIKVEVISRPDAWKTNKTILSGAIFWNFAERVTDNGTS
jgi:hypothetical protein